MKRSPLLDNLYKLVDRKPVRCADLREWRESMDIENRRGVALTRVEELTISTVFLGIDHNFRSIGSPILFETMIFGIRNYQTRCSTWEEAEIQHAEAVNFARKWAETENENAPLKANPESGAKRRPPTC